MRKPGKSPDQHSLWHDVAGGLALTILVVLTLHLPLLA